MGPLLWPQQLASSAVTCADSWHGEACRAWRSAVASVRRRVTKDVGNQGFPCFSAVQLFFTRRVPGCEKNPHHLDRSESLFALARSLALSLSLSRSLCLSLFSHPLRMIQYNPSVQEYPTRSSILSVVQVHFAAASERKATWGALANFNVLQEIRTFRRSGRNAVLLSEARVEGCLKTRAIVPAPTSKT